ncbi:MAG: hypothetical protein QM699_18890 [Amaricoccus sp.]|uniref:hypothetical protein n=1 Tax=Amaricoccus sp. TaxID=1872485 RepID=UPI0039E49CB9
MTTRMDTKLANIRAGRYKPTDFIIADAKDGDAGSGVTCAGFDHSDPAGPRPRTRSEFLDAIERLVEQDILDIMLLTVSNLELLHERGTFKNSAMKPAIRANCTTDCWAGIRNATYRQFPSRAFRAVTVSRAMTGTAQPAPGAPITGTDLGLYSVTFLNDLERDAHALEEFKRFREEAQANNFRYFYEVFNPNIEIGMTQQQLGEYLNDAILASLAGLTKAERPEFLKIPFNGPKALEELASFDSSLIVGILGGGAGTTRDTFELLSQGERYGARVALFGRKINLAELPLHLVALMRQVVDGTISPEEAVRAYHGELQTLGVKPIRPLSDDRIVTEEVLKTAAAKAA